MILRRFQEAIAGHHLIDPCDVLKKGCILEIFPEYATGLGENYCIFAMKTPQRSGIFLHLFGITCTNATFYFIKHKTYVLIHAKKNISI